MIQSDFSRLSQNSYTYTSVNIRNHKALIKSLTACWEPKDSSLLKGRLTPKAKRLHSVIFGTYF